MTSHPDPVSSGLVKSLARPGGNVTGLSNLTPALLGKQVQMLQEVVPRLSRVAVLSNPTNPFHVRSLKETAIAVRSLGARLQTLDASAPTEFASAFLAMTKESAGALIILSDPMFFGQRTRLGELTAKHHLPMIASQWEHTQAGGLLAYGPSLRDNYRRAATYVDKILKGAKPEDLPIEQPIKFELVINLKTAKALGVTTPPSLLQRADQVIE
jgi:putative ABC transport system substrate-binding protein